jgi:hypothetical protein
MFGRVVVRCKDSRTAQCKFQTLRKVCLLVEDDTTFILYRGKPNLVLLTLKDLLRFRRALSA